MNSMDPIMFQPRKDKQVSNELIQHEDNDFVNLDILQRPCSKLRRSSLVATLPDVHVATVDIQRMMEAGMNIARFRMTHTTFGDIIHLLKKINKAADNCCTKFGVDEWPIATCIELKTCIVRTGILEEIVPHIFIEPGSEVTLTCNSSLYNKCNKNLIYVDNPWLTVDVEIGTEIIIAADEIVFKCVSKVDDKSLKCLVTKGGNLKSISTMHARGSKHSRPYLTKRDLKIIRFALEHQVDIICINYVRHPETLRQVKLSIGKKTRRPVLLSGICTQEGLNNIDDIIKETDAIIFSREYLPYELESSLKHKWIQIQKWLGAKCQQAGKPYFISGGVLQDVIEQDVVCARDISDATNALFDGATGFILKDCDNVNHELKAIKVMNDLCCTVEPMTHSVSNFWRLSDEVKIPINAAEATMLSCVAAAIQIKANVVIIPTVTGKTAKILAWMRLPCLVIAVSTDLRTTRLLHTYRSVLPLKYNHTQSRNFQVEIEKRINYAVSYAVKKNFLKYGDPYVTLQRAFDTSSYCDTVKIWYTTVENESHIECDDQGFPKQKTGSSIFLD